MKTKKIIRTIKVITVIHILSFTILLAQQQPNIFLILADDLGSNSLSTYGSTQYQTPRIDDLAKGGIKFSTAWATPVCMSSRAELLTGRYGFRTGWRNLSNAGYTCNGSFPNNWQLAGNHLTFANILRHGGYTTAIAGKWMLQDENTNLNDQIDSLGFDKYMLWPIMPCFLPPDHGYPGSLTEKFERYWNPVLIKNGKYFPPASNDFGPDLLVDFLLDFVRESNKNNQPFLAYYPMLLPHVSQDNSGNKKFEDTPDPMNPGSLIPGSLKTSIEYTDHLVGVIIDSLEQMGLLSNTIVLFTGDNGTEAAGKGSVIKEEGVRVPMIAYSPNNVVKGVISNALIDFSDILPTLLELTGTTETIGNYYLDGKSFAPVLTGESFQSRSFVFSYLSGSRLLRDENWLLDGNGTFYNTNGSRNEMGYLDVTNSTDPDVVAARLDFESILDSMPVTGLVDMGPIPDLLPMNISRRKTKRIFEIDELNNFLTSNLIKNFSSFNLTDVNGRVVFHGSISEFSFVQNEIPNGFYFIKLFSLNKINNLIKPVYLTNN